MYIFQKKSIQINMFFKAGTLTTTFSNQTISLILFQSCLSRKKSHFLTLFRMIKWEHGYCLTAFQWQRTKCMLVPLTLSIYITAITFCT